MRSLGGDWPPGKKKTSHGFLLKKSSAGLFSIKPSGHLAALLTALLYGTVNFIVEHKWHCAHDGRTTHRVEFKGCPAIKEVGHGRYQSMGYIFFMTVANPLIPSLANTVLMATSLSSLLVNLLAVWQLSRNIHVSLFLDDLQYIQGIKSTYSSLNWFECSHVTHGLAISWSGAAAHWSDQNLFYRIRFLPPVCIIESHLWLPPPKSVNSGPEKQNTTRFLRDSR